VELVEVSNLRRERFAGGDFSQALHEYQVSLTADPNPFNALLGAGQTAEGLGNREVAAVTTRPYWRTARMLMERRWLRSVILGQSSTKCNRAIIHDCALKMLDTRITAVVPPYEGGINTTT